MTEQDVLVERPIFVRLECLGLWVDATTVVVEDVFEDFDGADQVGFHCPHCGALHYSQARGG